MSNIPNSAMPHAYVHDDEDGHDKASASADGMSLKGFAIAGGAMIALYWLFKRD